MRPSELQMFLLISGGLIGTPTWRLHTKLHKDAWNVSANDSETVSHKDLRLEKLIYILVFYNILFLWLLPLNGFQFIFCCVTVKSLRYSIAWHVFCNTPETPRVSTMGRTINICIHPVKRCAILPFHFEGYKKANCHFQPFSHGCRNTHSWHSCHAVISSTIAAVRMSTSSKGFYGSVDWTEGKCRIQLASFRLYALRLRDIGLALHYVTAGYTFACFKVDHYMYIIVDLWNIFSLSSFANRTILILMVLNCHLVP